MGRLMASIFASQLLAANADYGSMTPAMPPAEAWIMEPKLDGWRFTFHICEDEVVPRGRDGAVMGYRIPAYITDRLTACFPADTIVDCELIVPGGQSTDVSTALANHRAWPLEAWMFDVMQLAGQDIRHLPWTARRTLLEKALAEETSSVKLTPVFPPNLELFKNWVGELAMEGAVLKRKESRYSSGGRNGDWLKLKPQRTMDCRIVGLPKDGAGKFEGMVGAVEFEIEPGLIGRASGMTDLVRQEMTDHPERFIGRLAEFAYQVRTRGGHLRHPNYRRLRDDLEFEPLIEARDVKVKPGRPEDGIAEFKPKKETAMSKPAPDGWSRRNYNAMKVEKLEQCITELETRSGDAYDRVTAKNANPDADLAKAREALAQKKVTT